MIGLFKGLLVGFLLTILLPVAGLFVALPLGIIMIFMVFSFPVLLLLYFFTQSQILGNIIWGSLGFFIGFLGGVFVLMSIGFLGGF